MDQKTNIYIVEKKEVFLIFLFMVLSSLISFMLGVKLGRSYSYEEAGLTPKDRRKINLLDQREEAVEEILEKKSQERGLSSGIIKEQIHRELKGKIDQELKKSYTKQNSLNKKTAVSAPIQVNSSKNRRGQYTIQLGSYRTRKESEEFADGFRIKGRHPIITQVEIPGRGIWFRVSLGEFNNAVDAKNYVQKEKELFMGQDYVFVQFD